MADILIPKGPNSYINRNLLIIRLTPLIHSEYPGFPWNINPIHTTTPERSLNISKMSTANDPQNNM